MSYPRLNQGTEPTLVYYSCFQCTIRRTSDVAVVCNLGRIDLLGVACPAFLKSAIARAVKGDVGER